MFNMTPAAVRQLKKDLEEEAGPGDGFRVSVVGGGRSGLQYGFDFGPEEPGDTVLDLGGMKILMDPQSAAHLQNATLDHGVWEGGSGYRFVRDRG
jgi:iron-sulfur cluster assembly protein